MAARVGILNSLAASDSLNRPASDFISVESSSAPVTFSGSCTNHRIRKPDTTEVTPMAIIAYHRQPSGFAPNWPISGVMMKPMMAPVARTRP